jgi:outer membrane cobalamin receptor
MRLTNTALLFAASFVMTDVAFAADEQADAGAPATTSGDIVVTARRREESLQKGVRSRFVCQTTIWRT